MRPVLRRCLKRIYAPRNLYEAVCESLTERAKKIVIGDGLSPGVEMGPIQNRAQFDKVCAIVDDARAAGGRILTGGEPMAGDGYFYPPTLVADLTDGVRLVDEEQFGPVIPIVAYDDLNHVIDNLNAGPYVSQVRSGPPTSIAGRSWHHAWLSVRV